MYALSQKDSRLLLFFFVPSNTILISVLNGTVSPHFFFVPVKQQDPGLASNFKLLAGVPQAKRINQILSTFSLSDIF